MDTKKALKVLRLQNKSEISDNDIESAFKKMLKRYPPEVFAEKSLEIRQAYALLSNSDEYWSEFIRQERFDFSSMVSYVKNSKSIDSSQSINALELLPEKLLLQKISGPLLSKICDEELMPDDDPDQYL
ncbi:MAG: hypothetical protein ISR65_17815 [Bacteriovoracaceae bacterium]|nr:hypothetical protein [Bacteriovoracaceae bacterium]